MHSQSKCTPVLGLSAESSAPAMSLSVPFPYRATCPQAHFSAKGQHFRASCLGSHPELSLQLPMQLHPQLPALKVFLNSSSRMKTLINIVWLHNWPYTGAEDWTRKVTRSSSAELHHDCVHANTLTKLWHFSTGDLDRINHKLHISSKYFSSKYVYFGNNRQELL